jgi:hypothetical protein
MSETESDGMTETEETSGTEERSERETVGMTESAEMIETENAREETIATAIEMIEIEIATVVIGMIDHRHNFPICRVILLLLLMQV